MIMSKIDVFGSTGFIGSRFCELYSDEVVRVSRECNIPDNKDILYLISTTDNYNVYENLHKDINTNLNKLMDVLENCKYTGLTFNYISSWFVYGEGNVPAREDQPCNPKGFYSITKLAAEQLLISFCQTFGINYRILRLCNVYGPGDNGRSKKKNALQYLIDEMKSGRDINLYQGGNFIRDYMHVDDVCRAIKLCITNGPVNEIINIGSGTTYIFKNLIDFVSSEIGYKGDVKNIDPTDFHKIVQVKNFYLDNTKLKNLGFQEKVNIKEGLRQLL
jgi:nucleoside-diphosphate-sugar epimerase